MYVWDSAGSPFTGAATINLVSMTGGYFDGVDYNDTGIDRGYVIVDHVD
jgi:hypothetical protein